MGNYNNDLIIDQANQITAMKEVLKALDKHTRRFIFHKDGTCTMELDFPSGEMAKKYSQAAQHLSK